MSTTTSSSVIRGPLIALLGYFVFSTHDAIVKSLENYSVFQTIFFAMLFGYVPFSLARITDKRLTTLRPNNPALVILRSALMVGAMCFAFIAFSILPMVQVYVLLFTTPVMISLLAIPILGEKIHFQRWTAIILGLIGVIIVLRPTPESLEWGHIFSLISAFCGASASIISRKIGNQESSATLILFPLLFNVLIAGATLYFVYKPMPFNDLMAMFAVGVLGLLGQLLVLNSYRLSPAAFVAPMQYSQLIWAVLFGFIFFNESIDQWVVVGSIITIASGVMIVWREAVASKTQPNLNTPNPRITMDDGSLPNPPD
ncbi:MAG: DMT family transporter [Thiofilum sp.]|uniref:DMT family transporter n=1 Tax=Thiofilum sp. TaxID=2212733 RepID=UPI0025FAA8EF|nr:DMT family transporter [Thiofilum sp.]MBK8454620.1 DMT family transporter [Thiofilum sp.]